jgi:alpha-galactosidase
MLEIGNGGMTNDEYVVHMSLWSITKAPLIIGCDLRSIGADTLAILSNPEVIAINQDALGVQGRLLLTDQATGIQLWSGPLQSGARSLVVVNSGSSTTTWTVDFSKISAPTCNHVRDLWAHQNLPDATGTMQVSHA